MIHTESRRGEHALPASLRPRSLTCTIRREEADKPILIEIRINKFRPRLLRQHHIPWNTFYESFRVIGKSSYVMLQGEPSNLWQLEELFGSTCSEAFLTVAEAYAQLKLPLLEHRDIPCPNLTLEFSIEGSEAQRIQETLSQYLSTLEATR